MLITGGGSQLRVLPRCVPAVIVTLRQPGTILIDHLFRLRANGTDVRTEVVAGLTTFLTMSYILFVNPAILSSTGMDKGAVFVAACLAAAIGSGVMAFVANWPVGMAPGMGLNTCVCRGGWHGVWLAAGTWGGVYFRPGVSGSDRDRNPGMAYRGYTNLVTQCDRGRYRLVFSHHCIEFRRNRRGAPATRITLDACLNRRFFTQFSDSS